ncbi:LysR substrate-binding domain-containing protein [Xinfangfangia sp. CPCC 101601]|uniref:LysR substrate-binding domain-containing protein n=1 Tax=Pseudogemmobacter lacusdianii TaxID=3069608 RepID=A0ABU0W1A0_9RHOB|nr:LysR substrate-binding domain-containing protein [Xinfangfangia sp. CPCC 101601]MDQ2067796.1 LysR substrate-binding domain-containing protein [Xinfangfangia sp. CPCC 101601]
MHRLRTLVPSANHLFVFEAAARRGSFTAAAEELNVSQPAVSKTIKALEEATGLQLFRRRHTSVELTAEGKRLYKETQTMFDKMHMVITALRSKSSPDVVHLSFSTTFVQMWLLPRLKDFKAKHPNVSLRIEQSTREDFDLDVENIDLSARLGDGKWPGVESWLIAPEEIMAVCSPDYLATSAPIDRPADLLQHSLLHFEEKYRMRLGWHEWLLHHSVQLPKGPKETVFTDSLSSVEAAVLGHGVALAWRHLSAEHIRRGRLICPLPDHIYKSGEAIYLTMPIHRTPKPGAALFRDWLVEQVALENQAEA